MLEGTSGQRVGYAISSVDSTPLYYELSEPRVGTCPIVLCDGIGCDGFIWKYIKPQLAETHQVLNWHYRGHGRSPNPTNAENVRIEDLSDDLASVIDDADLGEVIVIGHSMGVQVALEFHRRHRDSCNALVLMCGAHSEPLKTFKRTDLLDATLPSVRKAVWRAPGLFSSIGRVLLPRDWVYHLAAKFEFEEKLVSHQDFMPYLKSLALIDPTLFLAMLGNMGRHSCRDHLSEIYVPALVIAGELDTFTPPELGREMAALIPGAKFYLVDQGTHTSPLEFPNLVGSVILKFLDRLPRVPVALSEAQ